MLRWGARELPPTEVIIRFTLANLEISYLVRACWSSAAASVVGERTPQESGTRHGVGGAVSVLCALSLRSFPFPSLQERVRETLFWRQRVLH